MISTTRKAEVIRNAVLSRLPRPDGAGLALTDEEAAFLEQHGEHVDALAARIVTAVEAGAAEIATGRRLWPGRR